MTGRESSRLGWLDALRGIAALLVVWEHYAFATSALPGIRASMLPWVKTGDIGVFLFFLISGYIIPASLEKRGSVRSFWISRFFRLYPMVALLLVTVIVLRRHNHYFPDPFAAQHPATSIAAHATMLQDLLGVPDAVWVLWSLSYEMVFYLVTVAVFVAGVSRFSAQIAVGIAAAAVLVFPFVTQGGLWGVVDVQAAVAVVVVLFAIGIAASMSGSKALVSVGSGMLGVLALSLVVRNSFFPGWQGLCVLATMFLGTAIYRAHSGQISARRAAAACATVFVLVVAAAVRNTAHLDPGGEDRVYVVRRCVLGLSIAAALFAGGLLLRDRRIPRAFRRLGEISFSVYLLHPVLLVLTRTQIDKLSGHLGSPHAIGPLELRLLLFVDFTLLVIGVSVLTHRYVEKPGQRLGRIVDAWLQARVRSHPDVPVAAGRTIGRQRTASESPVVR
jgi:peptidoglycan/LPS O-acetylase OafA/YrhL